MTSLPYCAGPTRPRPTGSWVSSWRRLGQSSQECLDLALIGEANHGNVRAIGDPRSLEIGPRGRFKPPDIVEQLPIRPLGAPRREVGSPVAPEQRAPQHAPQAQ